MERLGNSHDAAGAITSHASELGIQRLLVASELLAAAPALDHSLREHGLSWSVPAAPEEVRHAPLGVSLGRAAIAETGSVMLGEESLNDRAIGMLAAVQIIVCRTGALAPSLDEVTPLLRDLALKPGGSYTTLVTGPSRTADIERVLTVGVQGPGRVIVLFVDDLT